MRQSAFQHLMGGSVRYQAEHITRHGNKNFTDLGQSFLRAMEFFQMGVRDRLIDSHYDYLDHHTFSYTDPKTGEVITCRIWSNE